MEQNRLEEIHSFIPSDTYSSLVQSIGRLLQAGRERAARSVNEILIRTYWEIGHHIVEFEQNGSEKAKYGTRLLDRLSRDLTTAHGKGFSRSNVQYMRKLYLSFPICETLSRKLSWSHYFEILKADSDLEISFYAKQAEKEMWSVRELKRQMQSMLFHRIALSKSKEQVLEIAKHGHEVLNPADLIREPFVLEFLNIPENSDYLESELEAKIIDNLQKFLLELGKGFAFIGRQFRITIGGRHFYLDLLFYHCVIKCFILIDLKRGEIDHLDIGEMNMYLNYFKEEQNTPGDVEPIGIILGAHKDELLVEYSTRGMDNQIIAAKYQLYLPEKEVLQREISRILAQARSA